MNGMEGFLLSEQCGALGWIAPILGVLALGFYGAPFFLWGVFLVLVSIGFALPMGITIALLVFAAIGTIKPLRTILVSRPLLSLMIKLEFMPKISDTEKTALDAGTVWVEGDLFSGKPDFERLFNQPEHELSADEKSFLANQVTTLCSMIDDWKFWKQRKIDDACWDYIRKEKFLGMIIPKEYGGLGFSATAHSEVIKMIASRSLASTIYVMVPNSLGPAELLIHYGTDEQKKRLLPRLASGEEIPCFALTEPTAGSDAGGLTADGVLFKGSDGKLMMRLNWNKRYITLASISTILGLAFRLRDPDNLLGKGTDLGITCALIPSNTKGVVIGRRHDPLGTPFHNCPTQGHNVEVSVDLIVGGIENAGLGWKMLMECLAAGRGVSFPAQAAGGTQAATRVVAAYAQVRQQFGVSIGRFEGVAAPIARITGFTYLLESLRRYTLSALDQGLKPSVVTAISKYHSTELARRVVSDGMDVMGGAAISLGPKNLMGHQHIAAPIAITVEGANILTRTLMIFGQGALRAHPYAYKELKAIEANDASAFDTAFWGHIGHVVRNMIRSLLLSATRGYLSHPLPGGSLGRYYRRMSWTSASFAFLADVAMGSLGGKLKFKESLTGRFADIFSYMYIGTAILRRFKADGSRREDLPLVHYTMQFVFNETQKAFDGIYGNLEVPGLTWFFRGPMRFWSNLNTLCGEIADKHVHRIAEMTLDSPEQIKRITPNVFVSKDPEDQAVKLEAAVVALKASESVLKKIRKATKAGVIKKAPLAQSSAAALEKGVITAAEKAALADWERLRLDIVQVDDFSEEEYMARGTAAQTSASRGSSGGPSPHAALNRDS